MAVTLDKRVGAERKQFASQVPAIDEPMLEFIKSSFTGDKSVEFYEGLLAGYAASYVLVDGPEPKVMLGCIMAYLSGIVEERT